MPSDIEIARAATLEPIAAIAERAGIPEDAIRPYGKHIAKVDAKFLAEAHQRAQSRPKSKLILVTAINPTAAGEGKTTTSIGLADAMRRLGKKVMIALREPSLGPCFGMKGGATGGGYAQVVPMEDINLHFTGDFHAITSAHNLLAAMIDNHIYFGAAPQLDSRRVNWRRVMDMNDRALRQIVCSLGGASNGYPRETGFDITAASEIMAIFCLARDLDDLKARLDRIIIGIGQDKQPVSAAATKATGAMTVLLKDALMPNLVQTLEGTPTFVHGGPFANIAHGCNSVIATTAAMDLADYVVTEAGFGADLGAEKFFDIKCRMAGLSPSACVVVATLRALKAHGGVAKADLSKENPAALKAGLANLGRHVANVKKFGLPVLVAINHFKGDPEGELEMIASTCRNEFNTEAILCKHWGLGGAGAIELAEKAVALADSGSAAFHELYPLDMPIIEKMRTIATQIYGAAGISIDSKAQKQIAEIEAMGFGNVPVCVAKTQYSFSTDPAKLGAPEGFTVPVREVRLSAGAGFVVMITGEILTMPGLPRKPAAEAIHIDANGDIDGLF